MLFLLVDRCTAGVLFLLLDRCTAGVLFLVLDRCTAGVLFACALRCDEERTAERLFCELFLTVPELERADLAVELLLTADVFRR